MTGAVAASPLATAQGDRPRAGSLRDDRFRTDGSQRGIAAGSRRRVPAGTPGESLFAVLDAARDETIFATLYARQAELWVRSLYQGETAARLAEVAPYLVRLDAGSWVERWVLESGWGHAWGILLWSAETPDRLRRHFRKLTVVTMDDGERWLFRFYDPRVLRVFLPTCDAEQLGQVFGPVRAYCLEDESPETCVEFALSGEALQTRHHRITAGQPTSRVAREAGS